MLFIHIYTIHICAYCICILCIFFIHSFIHSSVDEQFGCFLTLAIANNAAVDMKR